MAIRSTRRTTKANKRLMNTSTSIHKKEEKKVEHKKEISPPAEDQSAKILRILKSSRERLRGRGMPELDGEVDELISELEGGGK